ncbi:CaiB/BaiF CoA transferase family protein [Usitatibacter palustris]|uniref:Acetyl-CoA:oxalate CoA-transferase n=1 Tax=Usitatibacter palustris TaxID=2732487 RepID=A0A6M4H843_9PROT|nr:CaiB/BaiF CoA-transferase family protein [Usitatibacter palustris]QJR15028.1 Acetyl-CoA:oxalate CoA-transferase [Usitatibacter palustris]
MPRILDGIRVLDFSRVLAGPWATQMLADFGAEVVKVERPSLGDDTRHWGPPWVKDPQGRDTAEAAYYLAANRGKKSITLDLKKPEGQAIARELAAKADVFVENYKVGDLARFGLDYATLAAKHPGLVYCSITGFGQDGPYSDRPGYDFIVQGIGGLMSITGERDDQPGGGPQKVGVAVSDLMTGVFSSNAIMAALFHRERTGQGQHIDMALLDVQVAMLANMATGYLASGVAPVRFGNAHQSIVPYQVFKASDGHFVVTVGNDRQFAHFCDVLGTPEWKTDPRFATNPARVTHRDVLVPEIAKRVALKPVAHWLEAIERFGVPCGPINDLGQVFADPQVRHRQMVLNVPHADAGEVRLVASPMKFSATPVVCDRAPPRLGEHTDEVLRDWIGRDTAAVQRLRGSGIV